MPSKEEITKIMETPKIQVGGTTKFFHGVVIKTSTKVRTNTSQGGGQHYNQQSHGNQQGHGNCQSS